MVAHVGSARVLTVAAFEVEGEQRFALFDHGSGAQLDMTYLYDAIILGETGDGRPTGFEITSRSRDGEITMLMTGGEGGGDISALVDAVVGWLLANVREAAV